MVRRAAPSAEKPTSINTQAKGSGTAPPLKPRLPKSVRPVPKLPPPPQEFETAFESAVTAPLSPIARPQMMAALVSSVMLWSAKIFPANVVPVPSIAELPTSQ